MEKVLKMIGNCSKRIWQNTNKTEVHKRQRTDNHTGQHVVRNGSIQMLSSPTQSLKLTYRCNLSSKMFVILQQTFKLVCKSIWSTETEISFPKCNVYSGNLEHYMITRTCWTESPWPVWWRAEIWWHVALQGCKKKYKLMTVTSYCWRCQENFFI